jgi:hypothetical protein
VDDLRLTLIEPHPTEANEATRTWFLSFRLFAM